MFDHQNSLRLKNRLFLLQKQNKIKQSKNQNKANKKQNKTKNKNKNKKNKQKTPQKTRNKQTNKQTNKTKNKQTKNNKRKNKEKTTGTIILLWGSSVQHMFNVVTTQTKNANCEQETRRVFTVLYTAGGNILKECNIFFRFDSPQIRRDLIFSIINFAQMLPQGLPHDELRMLGN